MDSVWYYAGVAVIIAVMCVGLLGVYIKGRAGKRRVTRSFRPRKLFSDYIFIRTICRSPRSAAESAGGRSEQGETEMNSNANIRYFAAFLLTAGGVVIILSLLMGWFNFIGTVRSGFDLLTDMLNEQAYSYAPHVAIVVGAVAVIAGILCIRLKTKSIPALAAVLGIVNVIFSALFAVNCVDAKEYYHFDFISVSPEIGVWASVAGGIIVAAASVVMLLLSRE